MATTTLNGGITSTATTMVLTSATGFPVANASQAYEIIITSGGNTETVRVIDSSSYPTVTIQRGMRGTTAQAWSDGAALRLKGSAFSVDEQKQNRGSIVGLTGTKSQFDTALTDGNFLYVGDITQYTDELAQDAVGAMVDTTIVYTDGTPLLSRAALTGDVIASAGSNATTIANDAVTYAKMQNVSATDKLLGRVSSGAGNVEEIDCTAAGRALLDDADATAQRTTLGLGTLATQNGTFSGTSSGTNTGDQTSIVGITGTKAQFDTAVTDGNILYVGDVTQYTDEMAQDAVGAMIDSTLVYTDGTPLLVRAALTGDVTASAGSNATSIAVPASATVAANDKVLIKDTDDSNATKYVTAQSIADLASSSGLTQPQVMARLSVGF